MKGVADKVSHKVAAFNTLRLEDHPSIVFEIGFDHIIGDIRALIKLVKKTHHAGASQFNLNINTETLTIIGTEAIPPETYSSFGNERKPKTFKQQVKITF